MHTGMGNYCSMSPRHEYARWKLTTAIPILFACFVATLWPFLCLVTFLMFFHVYINIDISPVVLTVGLAQARPK